MVVAATPARGVQERHSLPVIPRDTVPCAATTPAQ